VRFALADRAATAGSGPKARAVLDSDGTMPGRGAYICRGRDPLLPAADCFASALRRGAVARALRAPVAFDPKLVESVGS